MTTTELDMIRAGDNDRMLEYEVRRQRAVRRAREIVDAENRPPAEPFDLDTLAGVLARPAPPAARIAGLVPWEASTLVVAERKAGKTTLVLNMARSLLTGEPFLGGLEVRPLDGTVAVLNFEVSGAQLARWASDVGVPDDRLILANLRGRRNPLASREESEHLAGLLRAREVEALIVDPFGRAFTGKNQNDAGEVSPWLVDLDRFARAGVGALDLILCAHAGWNAERSRGSSALEDWPDSIVTLARDNSDTGNGRYLRAIGRDIDLDEDRLEFDPQTRQLTLAGSGSRRRAAGVRLDTDTRQAIIEALTDRPEGLNGKELSAAIGRKDGGYTAVRDALVASGVIEREQRSGRGGGYQYTLCDQNVPKVPGTYRTGTLEHAEGTSLGPSASSMHVRGRRCRVCGELLDPAAIAGGYDTHPTCGEASR